MVVALPVDACSSLRNPSSAVRGAVVLARVGQCDLAQKAVNVNAAGAAALILIQDLSNSLLELPSPVDSNNSLVVDSLALSMVDSSVGLWMVGFIYEGGKLNLTYREVWLRGLSVHNGRLEIPLVSPPPTINADGRIKPDIIAPGFIITTTSPSTRRSSCNSQEYSGTSAATPLAAGHAALLRQYLRNGFYPTGARNDSTSAPFTPSGILLKPPRSPFVALDGFSSSKRNSRQLQFCIFRNKVKLIKILKLKLSDVVCISPIRIPSGAPHRGCQVLGAFNQSDLLSCLDLCRTLPYRVVLRRTLYSHSICPQGGWALNAGVQMGRGPDGYQGWGRLNLAGSLPLRGFTDPRVRLQLVDRGEFTAAGQSVSVGGITATGTGPVTAVLAYYDYPGDPNSMSVLVNNLDLELLVNDVAYLGNSEINSANPRPDVVNTVERVRLNAPPAGASLRIRVRAASLPSRELDPSRPQRWAVAVVGHFEGNLQSNLNPAWLKLMSPKPPPLPVRHLFVPIGLGQPPCPRRVVSF
ncbi:hypothetical protein VOLCADRAFT_91397 [Volvox carteri f. nagariensis]|uniref:Peptidase S8/S53 domain-containing protein n=1 Tax=Volvox carteri f. nagariensis TaxID=3068 RepID=D8TWY9_VOLCA|nr:uncharacterized protein VOLCADRAFT_91397 [Volvox carteri f. nagariensis]EFJ47816.1 hypothetical protein VOLCADRAFT_91397 [Volvox carteri f. nagariensis]|eukprot:XP_002950922.1 hypothetical protein VOLCADRAFT_91397 [Volvox carteri f. nagariensis]